MGPVLVSVRTTVLSEGHASHAGPTRNDAGVDSSTSPRVLDLALVSLRVAQVYGGKPSGESLSSPAAKPRRMSNDTLRSVSR
jgi:hypothetical protein